MIKKLLRHPAAGKVAQVALFIPAGSVLIWQAGLILLQGGVILCLLYIVKELFHIKKK